MSKTPRGKGKPFEKGNTFGKGRPKKEKCIPDILNRLTNEMVDGVPKRDIILMGVVDKALEGDQWSIQFIADRMEGKPFQTNNITLSEPDEVRVIG